MWLTPPANTESDMTRLSVDISKKIPFVDLKSCICPVPNVSFELKKKKKSFNIYTLKYIIFSLTTYVSLANEVLFKWPVIL